MPMTRDKAQARARQLVALATDIGSTESESRTAAIAACKLIDEHELLGAESNGDPFLTGRAGEAASVLLDELLKQAATHVARRTKR